MTIESTNDNKPTTPAITYSECYQQCFCSDNLELMKTIESNTIDLIYCDILYGTGRNFGDYQDLKPIRSEIEAHYLPRLKEMHRVLKSTGSIYLQMDTKINHWIRCLMDDVFGYGNFRNEIIWHYQSGGRQENIFSRKHDNILFYAKSSNWIFNSNDIGEERGAIKRNNMKKNVDEDGRVYWTIKSAGKIYKYYEDEKLTPPDVWTDISHLQQKDPERIGYPTQKPLKLLERIIKASSNEGDLVADFYLGSGTTAVVCKELNRKFIGCDINPKAIEITNARLDALS